MCEEIAPNINTEVRNYTFKGINNFRDLGGYRVTDGRMIAWNRLYRSAELRFMTSRDSLRLRWELKPAVVIDLRDAVDGDLSEKEKLASLGIGYRNVPVVLETRDEDRNSGEVFLSLSGQKDFGMKVFEVLRIIADSKNLPAIIHCNAGKNRTGVMTAILLGTLGVSDDDIVGDYCLSAPYMEAVRKRLTEDPSMAPLLESMPEYVWMVEPDSIRFFLNAFRERYGSFRAYANSLGADGPLFERLEAALLVPPPGPADKAE
jgi:protein-tyrosine phosphatase